MKRSIIYFAIFAALVFVGESNGQGVVVSVPASNGSELNQIVIRFTGIEGPNPRVFVAMIPASTESECLAATDFSRAVPADPRRTTLLYDPMSAAWVLRDSSSSLTPDSCRVVLVRSAADTADLTYWRSNFGATVSASANAEKLGTYEDGEVRPRPRYVTTHKAVRTSAPPAQFEPYVELVLSNTMISG